MDVFRSPAKIVSLFGLGLLVFGSYLPWICVNSSGFVPLIWLPGMDSGLDLWGLIILPLAVIAGVVIVWQPNRQEAPYFVFLVGTLAGVITVAELSSYPSLNASPFAPAIGVFLTLIGSCIVVVASGLQVYSKPTRHSEA